MNLLPYPRVLKRRAGFFRLPARAQCRLDSAVDPAAARPAIRRLQSAAADVGVKLLVQRSNRRGRAEFTFVVPVSRQKRSVLPAAGETYRLAIDSRGVTVEFNAIGGLRAAVATLRQIIRECGRRLPCLEIRDWPDFPQRGVMLDISRGRVPNLETLLELASHLADFKINELQLYTEHTFAYRGYEEVWRDWGAITGREIQRLDARCRELGIELVPNQNSFGHLRAWLEYPPLKRLAEVNGPYENPGGGFLRQPSTLAPKHPGTLPFLRRLYDELLPNFSSTKFNVGCDETWDLGRGQSRDLCRKKGHGRVYLDFLKTIHREVSRRGRRMMFWGDIILKYPKLIRELPRDVTALNWGYEADHPFAREAARFGRSKVPFYVCPGTSTWMTLIGRHDNALANLRAAARAGRRHGAIGYLITDWGDGGHPQPLTVSYIPLLAGAALSWCERSFREERLIPVLSRDVFRDPRRQLARAAHALGFAHCRFHHVTANSTPFGAVIAAPPPEWRELFCVGALDVFRRIPTGRIRAALREVEKQRAIIGSLLRARRPTRIFALELDLAARMAVQSCRFMLWQKAVAAGKPSLARRLAVRGIRELRRLEKDFNNYWPLRNKGTTKKSSSFLHWRADDYRKGELPG